MALLTHIRQSLITRLMLYFTLTAVFVAAAFAASFAYGVRVHFKQEILPNIVQYLQYIADDIGDPPDLAKAQRLSSRLSFELAIDGPGVRWGSHHRLENFDRLDFEPTTLPVKDILVAHDRGNNFVQLKKGEYRYTYVVGRLFDKKHGRRLILPLILLGAIGLLFVLIRSSLKPLQPIHAAVRDIGRGELEPELRPQGSSEFRELAQGINEMAQQIQHMLQAKQSLLLAISHELRSPLTRARINIELLPVGVERDALIEDIHEMEQLVATILESERLNQRRASLDLTRFDLADPIQRLLQSGFADRKPECDLTSVVLEADRVRIELLIRNLLDNAFKYSSADDPLPVVRLRQTDDHAVIEVEDFGMGMNASEAQQACEAFYRADTARGRSTGGFGLGLYLCQQVVNAHSGWLEIQSIPAKGSRIRVTLPKKQPAAGQE